MRVRYEMTFKVSTWRARKPSETSTQAKDRAVAEFLEDCARYQWPDIGDLRECIEVESFED